MGKQGQYNYKGVNAQAWAAMSLFLQHLRDPHFSYIQLESPKFEDFNLVFDDGHKIICESKAHGRNFSFSNLKSIIWKVAGKGGLYENDEILIICEKLDEKLADDIRHMKYFSKEIAPNFVRKGFREGEIELLKKVKFWKVAANTNKKNIYFLFSELINFWLPDHDLKRIADSILMQNFYKGSARGLRYSRTEILSEIDGFKREVIKKSGYFDSERVCVEKQLDNIIQAIDNNKSPVWARGQLSSISAQPNLMYFILDRFKEGKINNLEDWKELWQLNRVYSVSLSLFHIFSNNLDSAKNREYVVGFIRDNVLEKDAFYTTDFFTTDAVRIVSDVIKKDKKMLSPAFNVVKKLLICYEKDDYFYITNNRDLEYKKKEVCDLLHRIHKDADSVLRNKIYQLIINYFNLIEDEGEFSHYTPKEVFNILYEYLVSDWNRFEARFINLNKELSQQYDKSYKKFGKKVKFEGWDLMGGTSSHWGDSYKVFDRHFVHYTLRRSLVDYYDKFKKKAWNFIVTNCIHKEKEVNENQPDFLNRASIDVLLNIYKLEDKKISDKAFEILREFVLSRERIPCKAELIYQRLLGDYPDKEKLALIKLGTDKNGLPINPFVEQIASGLADKGYKEAKEALLAWIKNPAYCKTTEFRGRGIINNIRDLLDSSFDDGVEIFKNYIGGEYFIKGLDDFSAYKVAGVLNTILKKDFPTGLKILNGISKKKILSTNQQILLCFSFLHSEKEGEIDIKFLKKIYIKFVNRFLNGLNNDIDRIYKKLPHSNAREAFVQFAEKLAKSKQIKKALRIIEVFVDDPDPFMPGKDPEDTKAQYCKHKEITKGVSTSTINTVRGWCAWSLMNCVVLDGRNYIPKIIRLTKQLTQDKNYYVNHMACFPLHRLARFRLSHLPDKKTLFFDNDKKKALRKAKRVEKIAFDLLRYISQLSVNVQKVLVKSVLMALNNMRALNEKDALNLVNTLKKFPDEVISDTASVFIYYAEIRKKMYRNWPWAMPGLYDDLQEFDDKKFKLLLKAMMLKNATARGAFSWEFYKMTDSALRKVTTLLSYNQAFNMSVRYIKELISKYDPKAFENVYHFIEDNISQPGKFDACYELWKKCLDKERPAIEASVRKGKISEVCWSPFFKNGEILEKLKQEKDDKVFLDSFEFLSKYPKESRIGDISKAVELLKAFSADNEQVERIFNNLMDRNSDFYNDKKQWVGKCEICGEERASNVKLGDNSVMLCKGCRDVALIVEEFRSDRISELSEEEIVGLIKSKRQEKIEEFKIDKNMLKIWSKIEGESGAKGIDIAIETLVRACNRDEGVLQTILKRCEGGGFVKISDQGLVSITNLGEQFIGLGF